jgi:preprotein translocase subunit SecY
VVIPHFEELQDLGEQGSKQLQIYMRYITFPLAFVQSIGMVFFINSLIGGLIDTSSWTTVLLAAFVLAVGSMIMVFIEILSQKKVSLMVHHLLIFASIIAGIVTQFSGSSLLVIMVFQVFISCWYLCL